MKINITQLDLTKNTDLFEAFVSLFDFSSLNNKFNFLSTDQIYEAPFIITLSDKFLGYIIVEKIRDMDTYILTIKEFLIPENINLIDLKLKICEVIFESLKGFWRIIAEDDSGFWREIVKHYTNDIFSMRYDDKFNTIIEFNNEKELTLIVNENIKLKQINISDAFLLNNLIRNKKIKTQNNIISSQTASEDTKDFIVAIIKNYYKNRSWYFGVWHGPEFKGIIGLNNIDWHNNYASLAFCIDEAKLESKLAVISIQKFVSASFEKLNLHRIQIIMDINEIYKIELIKNLNFTLEGTLKDYQKENFCYVDNVIYSIIVTK